MECFVNLGDELGQATCHLMRGDWEIAPISSPLIWNTVSSLPHSEGGIEWGMESLEAEVPSSEAITRAAKFYTEAFQIYSRAAEFRGLGAYHLRFCYLESLRENFEAANSTCMFSRRMVLQERRRAK